MDALSDKSDLPNSVEEGLVNDLLISTRRDFTV
jgi:hypothetical protein